MNASVFPSDWERTALEVCVDILDSQRLPVNNKERQARIQEKAPDQLYPYFGATGEVGKIDDYLFDEKLVALGEDGVPFLDPRKPKAYMLFGKTWVNNHAHVLRAARGITTNRFLLHYLNQFDYQGFVNGGTRLKLTQANMRRMPYLVAPLAEQKVIADKLDTLLAQVENTKARLERIPQILKRFRQSVLAAAVSGRLTEEWRELNERLPVVDVDKSKRLVDKRAGKLAAQPLRDDEKHLDIPESWVWTRLVSIAEIVSGVAKGSKTNKEVVEIPYLRVANVQRGYLDLREVKTILVPIEKAKALSLKKGDVLFNEGGDIDKLGRGWIWNGEIDGCIHQNHVFRARCYSSKFLPKFISFYGNSEGRAYFIQNGTQSVNLASINKTTLSLLPVPVPPFEEQAEIVRRVDQLFAHADRIEQQVDNALARVNNLTQSILAKAFRGELTEQWRKDNPELISGENSAEALLQRIKAEQAIQGLKKQTRKKAKV